MLDGIETLPAKRPKFLSTLLIATVIAGTLDIATALLFWGLKGVPPGRILQGIASGLLGRPAFDGGGSTAALGLALHFCMMAVMVGAYFWASRRAGYLIRRPLLWGAIYGVALLGLMNYVVVPLSAFPGTPVFNPVWFLCDLGSHVFFVGIPIALYARRALATVPQD
ncbi:MAG TPA: hypothetical protein VLG68_07915 [Gammaproteobacteria bacterium]|nr:hypothetical protein [Gammaproteobacteria bacterium]